MDNNELHEKYEKLMENFKCMKDENKKLNDMNMFLSTKLNKFEMQKELLSKDIAKNIDNLSLILSSKKVSNINFSDTLKEQMKLSRKFKIVSRCAYKWLYLARKRIYERINDQNKQPSINYGMTN